MNPDSFANWISGLSVEIGKQHWGPIRDSWIVINSLVKPESAFALIREPEASPASRPIAKTLFARQLALAPGCLFLHEKTPPKDHVSSEVPVFKQDKDGDQ